MHVPVGLLVVADNGIRRRLNITMAEGYFERLLRRERVLVNELVYYTNSKLKDYAWDKVQILGNDGGLLAQVMNPQRLDASHHHPPTKGALLRFIRPAE